jgi:KaiC/GvpD/RAD55 family RecA-like ATPase
MPERRRDDLFIRVNDVEPANWIIEAIAMEQGLTVIYGDRNVGKTTLSMQMLHTLLTGNSLFGLDVRPANAFLLEQDESPRIFRNHRDRVLRELPSLENMEIPKVNVSWDARQEDFTNLVDLIRAYPAKIVIIDSFTSLGVPDLNHPNTSAVLDRLRQINHELDCSFILLHHLNRKGEILGSITLQIKADNLIEFTQNGLIFQKMRGQPSHLIEYRMPILRRNRSILFKLGMSYRARMICDNPEAREILRSEYPESTAESIRTTLSRARTYMTDRMGSIQNVLNEPDAADVT